MVDVSTSCVVLLRLSQLTSETRNFADRLARESGHHLACLVDERRSPVDVSPFPKVSLTGEACRALGLYWPRDAGWRCGDYGLYIARKQFPTATHFWIVEYDVRISGTDLSTFFGFFTSYNGVDLIAPQYKQADSDWYWYHSVRARNVTVYRCLFPIVRLSAGAVDRLLLRRQRMSREWIRLVFWPNDESTVATTLANDGSACRDLNDFGRTFYTDETFSFYTPRDGDALNTEKSDAMVYHPVLFGEDYQRKLAKLQKPETQVERFRHRLGRRASRLNGLGTW